MSVCPSAWTNSAFTGRILMKHGILAFFRKSVEKLKFHSNPTRIMGTLHENVFIFMTASRCIFPRMTNVSDKNCWKNQITHNFCSVTSLGKLCRLWNNVEKYLLPVGARFSEPVQTGPEAHPASCTMGTGSSPGFGIKRNCLPQQWKESITVPVYVNGGKTDYSDYRGISLLSTTYKILSKILLLRLTPHAKEIIGDQQCGSWHNRSTTDHTFCICQILQKKRENVEAVHQLFVYFKKTLFS